MKNIIILLLVFILFGCTSIEIEIEETPVDTTTRTESEITEYHKINAEQAKQIMDSGEPYILLDVRTDSKYNEGHIEGAILIPRL